MLKIGLDIDDVICGFYSTYTKKFGNPKNDLEITRNVQRILIKDKDFWLSPPIIHRPNFVPTLYCTKRVHPKSWTKQYLQENNIPIAPIYQIFGQTASKAPKIKGRVDVFIDDSLSNFIDLNLHGIPCLLMDNPHNISWGPVARIYSLNSREIYSGYELFMNTLFPHFKELVNDYKQFKN